MRKGIQRSGIVTQHERTQSVAIPHHLLSQLLGEAHFRSDLAREGLIGLPCRIASLVRPQEICDQARIPTIVLGLTLAIPLLSTLHSCWRQNIDLFIALL